MIVTVNKCVMVMVADLKPNIWTCDPAEHMIVAPEPLNLNFSVLQPLVKITVPPAGISKVEYVDDVTNRNLCFENNSNYFMDGLSVHTVSSPRNYTITSGGNNENLFRTGGG